VERLTAINGFTREGMDWLRGLIAAHGIGCDLVQCGWTKAAATERGERAIANLSRSRQSPRGDVLTADEMHALVGSAFYRCGLHFGDAYLLQPAALIRGLGDTLPANVRLYEQTAVTAIEDCGRWLLRTSGASITADCVILANNALVKALGYLGDRLITIYTYAAMTEPISRSDDRSIGAAAWGVLPTHRLGTTSRRVGENRLLIRSLYSYERPMPASHVEEMLETRFRRRYPSLSDIRMEFVWGGTTALTMNGSPVWGAIGRGLYVSAGCNGAGIAKGTVLGKKLAEAIAHQRKDAEIEATFGQASWIAPEPLRTLGFRIVSAWEQQRAGLES
jgi:glycine/D-amino acid oxidase-like deaminating enzyme